LKQTTDGTVDVELLIGGSAQIILAAKSTMMFIVQLAAYNTTDNLAAGYFFRGVISSDDSSNTAIIGAVAKDEWEEGAMSGCDATVDADDATNALRIKVTGLSGKTINWHAVVQCSEVINKV
jgi:hypothetical protein